MQFKYKTYLICVLIVLISLTCRLFYLVPENATSISFFGISIHAGVFEDIRFYVWMISTKLMLVGYLLVWFFTNLNWWRLAVLVPLIIELIKLYSLLFLDVDYFDEVDYLYSLPLVIPIIMIFLIIWQRIRKQMLFVELDNEIDIASNKLCYRIDFDKIKNKYEALVARKNSIETSTYYQKLLELRQSIYEEFKT